MKKKFSMFPAFLLFLFIISGCSGLQVKDDPVIRANVDTMLSAIFSDDADTAYGAVCSEINRAEFDAAYADIHNILSDVTIYELTPIQYNYSNQNGVKSTHIGYHMATNAGGFVVSAIKVEGYDGLVSFYVTPEEQTTLVYSGTPGHMQGANAFQWIVLILGLLTWVFILWVFVDCSRRKIKHKALWLIFILLGALILSLSISGGSINCRFNVGLFLKLSTLMQYGDGSIQLSLVLPLGAIIYLLSRKKLIVKAEDAKSEPDSVEASTPSFREIVQTESGMESSEYKE